MTLTANTVIVSNRQRRVKLDIDALARVLDGVLALCDVSGHELSVTLVSRDRMRKLNREFRAVDSVTDVLSFPMREAEGGDPTGRMLGDLVLCPDVIVKASAHEFHDGRPRTGTPRRELALLAIHGILHLLGHTHENDPSAEADMISHERRLFDATWKLFPQVR